MIFIEGAWGFMAAVLGWRWGWGGWDDGGEGREAVVMEVMLIVKLRGV